jgi:mRNA-degrading endonuclease RelE of RelBE toxin-antitoxin system
MPNLKKLLSKFNEKERKTIESMIGTIASLDWRNLNVKKLRGYQEIFRVRKGKIRIVFTKNKRCISIITIERRCEDTYKF